MDNDKTLTYLYSNGKNRFAKVAYIFFYIIVLVTIYGWTIGDYGTYKEFFIPLIIVIIIFELIKKAFYYITLGTIRPKK